MHYTIRNIDDDLWKEFKVKCAQQGKSMIQVIIELITKYVNEV